MHPVRLVAQSLNIQIPAILRLVARRLNDQNNQPIFSRTLSPTLEGLRPLRL